MLALPLCNTGLGVGQVTQSEYQHKEQRLKNGGVMLSCSRQRTKEGRQQPISCTRHGTCGKKEIEGFSKVKQPNRRLSCNLSRRKCSCGLGPVAPPLYLSFPC